MVLKNYEKVTTKVLNIIRFWDRFNLTLPGKIAIYKTLLISQINFFACILTPTPGIVETLTSAMEAFVTKGLNISKQKKYSTVETGGIGLFDLNTFIAALQCTWIKRACEVRNDNWKYDLVKISDGNIVDGNFNLALAGPCLTNIINSFLKFQNAYYK